MIKLHWMIFIISIVFISSIFADENMLDKSRYYEYGKRFYYDIFYQPADNHDSVIVVSVFRASFSMLKFEKYNDLKNHSLKFVAYPRVEIEFRDADGIIRKRDIWKDTIYSKSYEEIDLKDKYIYGSLTTVLPCKSFFPVMRITDNETTRLPDEKFPELKLKDFYKNSLISHPLMTYKMGQGDNGPFCPFILNGSAGFSSKNIEILIPLSSSPKETKYSYSIEYLDIKNSNISWEGSSKLVGNIGPYMGKNIDIKSGVLDKPTVNLNNYNIRFDSSLKYGILDITFPSDKIIPGKFDLRVWSDFSKDTLDYIFKIEWEDMPLGLRNPDYAAEMMYYILTDDEYSTLKKGSQKDVYRKIFDYWKQKDPTPFTIFNEALEEYFRRVDYAFFNYQSIQEKDGAKTERGKIYILNGKPTKIERNIDKSNRMKESWIYLNQKKSYVFETDSNGIVFLTKIEDIK